MQQELTLETKEESKSNIKVLPTENLSKYKLHSKSGKIYIENELIYDGLNRIDSCYIDGLIGKISLMGVDLLLCIVDVETSGPISRIKKVLVLPLSPNISLHIHQFPKSMLPISSKLDSSKPPNMNKIDQEIIVATEVKTTEPVSEKKKSLYDLANSTLTTIQPTFKAGVVSATKILRDTNRMVSDLTFDDIINSICDLFSNGTFYYSDTYELFNDQSAFVFNNHIFSNLGDLDHFGKRILQGSVQLHDLKIDAIDMQLVLISRRSRHRNGLRYQKRGVDEVGHVANYVETVQKLSTTINKQRHLFTYTQIRGSVPLFWQQENGVKPLPKLKEDYTTVEQQAAMSIHLEKLKQKFKEITLLSLVELQGKEGVLGIAFQDIYNQLSPAIKDQTKYFKIM
eukprot:NODE_30_length_37342_cov_0.449507.p9 type:complete len:398 gc:universal NODE_30_length_37342_cov_0.449507:13902-15095(+)